MNIIDLNKIVIKQNKIKLNKKYIRISKYTPCELLDLE